MLSTKPHVVIPQLAQTCLAIVQKYQFKIIKSRVNLLLYIDK